MMNGPTNEHLLGKFQIEWPTFEGVEEALGPFQAEEFKKHNEKKKIDLISEVLLQLIGKSSSSFLLRPIISFIEQIRKEVLSFYTFSHFELWLNQFSGLSLQENYAIRGKIMGRFVPRDEYQVFFPIGMSKYYNGSHFITAHASPDLDTTIASFWGWMDAFAAKVSEGLHVWNVPGGLVTSQVEVAMLFSEILQESSEKIIMRTRPTLSLSSFDMLTQRGMLKKHLYEHALGFEHERQLNAVVLINDEGYYQGDWRSIDVEGIRQVIMLLNDCLRWLESYLHVTLISLFAKQELKVSDLPSYLQPLLDIKLRDCEPVKEFTSRQMNYLQDYLVKVLGVEKGLDCTFEELAKEMEDLSIADFTNFKNQLEALKDSNLFDQDGKIKENRPLLFSRLEQIVKSLSLAFRTIRYYVEKLEVALKIKTDVFQFRPQYLSTRTTVEEIKTKMNGYPYLTVNLSDPEGKLVPMGVIHATDLQKDFLGTVTLRDFSNREETKVPPYLEVISIIDHHKSTLISKTPTVAILSDSQSANTLVATLAFQINDLYSTNGMTIEEIDKQLKEAKELCIQKRLLQRKLNAQRNGEYFVDPNREYTEYRHYLYAILDDTDLLTKVSKKDVDCVRSLLNRMKSLSLRREVEVINFDDIAPGPDYAKEAAKKLLQNDDLYSLYQKVYESKERVIEENITNCAQGQPSNIFVDTKIQNECCRVGQTKIFAKNYPVFAKCAMEIRKIWVKNSMKVSTENEVIDLHLHMISTIASAEELYSGKLHPYLHQDELWIWIPKTEVSIEHLKLFLSSFKQSPGVVDNDLSVEIFGNGNYQQIFKESFLPIPIKIVEVKKEEEPTPIAVLKYRAGSINSRKALITPFLPKVGQ